MPRLPNVLNGVQVNYSPGVGRDVHENLLNALQQTIRPDLAQGQALTAVHVSSAADSATWPNRHVSGLACDLRRINDKPVSDPTVAPIVKALQGAFNEAPHRRENFGPALRHKLGEDWPIGPFEDHIHLSCNGPNPKPRSVPQPGSAPAGKTLVRFWIKAFIPKVVDEDTETVEAGKYKGRTAIPGPFWRHSFLTDNRGHSVSPDASSRIHVELSVRVEELLVVAGSVAQKSWWTIEVEPDTGEEHCKEKTKKPANYQISGPVGDQLKIHIVGEANNPCVTSPDIDFFGDLVVDRASMQLNYSGKVDEFPAFEAYASVNGGPALPVFRLGPKEGADVWNLFGPANRDVGGSISIAAVTQALKKLIDDGKIIFDTGSETRLKKELLKENSGTQVTDELQALVLRISELAGSTIRISSLVRTSGHHGSGRAVDIGNEAIAGALLPAIATDAQVSAFHIDEIIFDAGEAGQTDRNKWNYDQGAKHNYNDDTLDDHKDHIHFAVKE